MQTNSMSLALAVSVITATGALAHTKLDSAHALVGSHHESATHAAILPDPQPTSAADTVILAASSGDSADHSSMNLPSYTVGDLVISNVRAGATVPKAPVAGGYMM
ncbi:MAG: hypothetical protein AAGA00_15195, partial [Pseudomonadota bacterium]